MKGKFIIAATARPSRQGAGCDHFIGTLKESSPCLLLLGEGAAAAADVEGTPKMLDRARFELSGVPSTPVPGCAPSTLSRQERAIALLQGKPQGQQHREHQQQRDTHQHKPPRIPCHQPKGPHKHLRFYLSPHGLSAIPEVQRHPYRRKRHAEWLQSGLHLHRTLQHC